MEKDLVDYLVSLGYLKTKAIIEAFLKIKRANFLPRSLKSVAYFDEALPIGEGQTISQPAVVAFMIELLQPRPGDKILDVGSGSGWTSALLGEIINRQNKDKKLKTKNKKGKVIAIEILPELKKFGENNVAKYNFIKRGIVEFVCGDGKEGFKKESPFDKILVSAAAKEIPKELKNQLKIGGRLVIPVEDKESGYFSQSIWMLERRKGGEFKIEKYPGFVFVPLV